MGWLERAPQAELGAEPGPVPGTSRHLVSPSEAQNCALQLRGLLREWNEEWRGRPAHGVRQQQAPTLGTSLGTDKPGVWLTLSCWLCAVCLRATHLTSLHYNPHLYGYCLEPAN